MDFHGRLIGFRGAEHIGLTHGDRCVAGNQHLHQSADGLQSQRQGGDVVEQQIPEFTGEDSGLYSSTDGHHLIGIHRLAGIDRHEGAHQLLNHRHPRGTTHQHDVIDVVSRPA